MNKIINLDTPEKIKKFTAPLRYPVSVEVDGASVLIHFKSKAAADRLGQAGLENLARAYLKVAKQAKGNTEIPF